MILSLGTRILMSLTVKKIENRSTFAEVTGNIVAGCCFMKHGVE